MTANFPPYDAPRTIQELVGVALTAANDDTAWDAVRSLHEKGNRDVLQIAKLMSRSEHPAERRLAADILGQLGLPYRTFPEESVAILVQMLTTEEDEAVLKSIFIAFSHLNEIRVIPLAAAFSTHLSAEVRFAVALAVMGLEDQRAIDLLIRLSTDCDSKVRDWATFAIGTFSEIDTPEIRDALVTRLNDSDEDVRDEALVGLARRGDQRVIEPLERELSGECVGRLAVEAAEWIGSLQLRAALLTLRDWWDIDTELLERAIAKSQE